VRKQPNRCRVHGATDLFGAHALSRCVAECLGGSVVVAIVNLGQVPRRALHRAVPVHRNKETLGLYIYTYIYTHIHTHTHIYIYIYINVYIHIIVNSCQVPRRALHRAVPVHRNKETLGLYIYTYIYIYTYTHTHTYIYKYIYTYNC